MVDPLIAKEETLAFGNPATIVQLCPLSVELYAPLSLVPARIFVPIADSAQTCLSDNPELTVIQFKPLSDEKNMPLPSVPAKTLFPFINKLFTKEREAVIVSGHPDWAAVHVAPLFVE